MKIIGRLTYENLAQVYELLSADLPKEAIEHVSSAKSRKGYDTTGYGYQYCVNRLNEVVFGHWRDVATVVKEETGSTNSGKPMYKKIVHMTIQIGNWHWINGENQFEVLAQGVGYGGHESLEESSAYKGAYTNAFKKAVAMLGVGKKAFEGTLDEDLFGVEAQESSSIQTNTKPSQSNNKPSDQDNKSNSASQQPPNNTNIKMISQGQMNFIHVLTGDQGQNIGDNAVKALIFLKFQKTSRKDLTSSEATKFIDYLQKASKEQIKQDIQKYMSMTGGAA